MSTGARIVTANVMDRRQHSGTRRCVQTVLRLIAESVCSEVGRSQTPSAFGSAHGNSSRASASGAGSIGGSRASASAFSAAKRRQDQRQINLWGANRRRKITQALDPSGAAEMIRASA